jgi:hypothetical protein
MSSIAKNEVPHSKPISESCAAAWEIMKITKKERVQKIIDRMTPTIIEEAPPAGYKKREWAQVTVRPDLPDGFDPDGPQEWKWIAFVVRPLTVRLPDGTNSRPLKLLSDSTRPREWRKAQWGTRSKDGSISTRRRVIGAPDIFQGDEAINRFYAVCRAATVFLCSQHGPDADTHEDYVSSLKGISFVDG